MREKMERLVILPFSVGCVSQSSIAVAVRQSRKSKADSNQTHSMKANKDGNQEEYFRDDESNISGESNKSSFRSLLFLPKPNISTSIHRLVKGFKTFSHYFVYKDEMEELDEMEMEMEIGGPTDVKHVTHIGWDGSSTTNEEALMGWQNLVSPDSNSIPWRPSFDLMSMASQVVQPGQPHLLNASSAYSSS